MKKGDIVGRISYGKDILFIIDRIVETKNGRSFAILKGLTIRIEADAPIEDLELVEQEQIDSSMRSLQDKIEERIKKSEVELKSIFSFFTRGYWGRNRRKEVIYNGKILHLDGDRKYSEKSAKHYRELGLNAIVKNIPENQQTYVVKRLLERYKPDILVITGHDGMIKKHSGYNDIYNYRNSRHFINTVKEARIWGPSEDKLVIFARSMSVVL